MEVSNNFWCLVCLWILAWTSNNGCQAASFYGSSYISVPLQEARSSSDISFRFKTSRPDALLLLAAGRTDYCLVVLKGGTLKVRINLGAGEGEVATAHSLRLDDLKWHQVRLHRNDADFTLSVDGVHSTKLRLPGRFYELNIHYGLFVGGLGGFREIFLGLWDSFRGCIDDLHYNGIEVLARARDKTIQADAFSVTWECSPEFDASSQQDISFLEKDSYMTFPNAITKSGSLFQFALKTITRETVLFYATGPLAKPDFIAIELVEGHLRVSADNGAGTVDVFSDVGVSDGSWHNIQVQVSVNSIDLTVDGQSNSVRSAATASRYFELGGSVYVGGIETNRVAIALKQGVRAANSSLRGCVRQIHIDGKLFGFRETRASRNVAPDCEWDYPCTRDPCVQDAVCTQEGLAGFRCTNCRQATCTKPEFAATNSKVVTQTGNADEGLEVLNLAPLRVTEGGSVSLTSKELNVVLDYEKFGIRESGILFHVVQPPQHGRLSSSLWRRTDEATFTLLDVHSDRLRYIHDGSETTRDTVTLELELASRSDYLLPAYLQKRQRFVMQISVTAVNDPPDLSIPAGKVLRLVKNSKKPLTQDLLNAKDPDNAASDLTYTLLPSSGNDPDGFIGSSLQPGIPLSKFTQQDINDGYIFFVHHGVQQNGRLSFQVSDGMETGGVAVLRISAFDLQIFLVNNTGLVVPINGSAGITSYNLTLATNAPDQSFDIRFDVTQSPQYGALQKFKASTSVPGGSGRWQSLNSFTSSQLQRERIRYIHTIGSPTQDEFKFTVSIPELEFRPTTLYEFRIQFLSATLQAEKNEILVLKSVPEAAINTHLLKYRVDTYSSSDEEIFYTILEPPKFGNLFLSKDSKGQRLSKGSKITQSLISGSRLQYRLSRRTLSPLKDTFQFQVSTAFLSTPPQTFHISYVPGSALSGHVTMETVGVNEGESAPIRRDHLNIRESAVVLFNVTKLPAHGTLNLLDLSKRQLLRRNVTIFTSEDIADERIVYTHDDSETTADDFEFLANPRDPILNAENDFQALGRISFSVQMKNDNPPYRVIDKVFHVVTNGERVLSSNILRYGDPDINTLPSSIIYNRRGISNGMLFHSDKPTDQVYEFTQEDIDQGKIVFKHQGVAYGKMALWVSDGQFHATGILQIQASDPFLEISNNTALTVKRGTSAPLTVDNIGLSSNLDFQPDHVTLIVAESPESGSLEKEGSKTNTFTLADILGQQISYNNDNSLSLKDSFKFRALLKDVAEVQGSLQIRIFPESYWEPLRIVNNRILEVEESTRVTIDQSALKTLHPNIVPTDIVYIVHQPPINGYLEIDHDDEYDIDETTTLGLPPEVSVFDQSIINDNRLHYIQSAPNHTSDYFVFDVSNGINTVKNLTFNFSIIPKLILLETEVLTVTEGGLVAIPTTNLRVSSQYYKNRIDEFLVTKAPVHGTIRLKQSSERVESISRFTPAQMAANQIFYVHDGSEDTNDTLEIVAAAGKKESVPAVLNIQIRSVDDEKPILVNNTGLVVWEGSITALEPTLLGALDVDTPPESIYYSFTKSDCGFFAMNNNSRQAASNFSQKSINEGKVSFVHSGKSNCSIPFTLTDTHTGITTHSVAITSRKLQLLLPRNSRLHVFPMMQQSITSSHLLAVTSDYRQDRNPRFKVTRSPRLGRLLLEQPDGSTRITTSFTQRDLNQSLVIYEHTEPFADLTVNDLFTFTVHTDWANPIEDRNFHIEISVVTMAEGGLDRYLGLKPLQVDEGSSILIKDSNFNISGIVHFISSHRAAFAMEPPKLRLILSTAPVHGFISVDGNRINPGTEIPLKDISASKVKYHHDNSDTLHDSLGLSIFLQRDDELQERRPDILLYNGTLRISILPVNDEPFVLLTKAPAMQVVQRQSRIITSEILLTEDADTSPRDLIYEVIQQPARGKLSLQNTTGTLDRFTQEDINQNRVVYMHDGSMEPTFFYFKVSDGRYKPVNGVFSIQVIALTLNLAHNSPIRMQQGHTTAVILNSSLAAESNGQRKHIFYNITQEPQFGRIYVNDGIVTTFGQTNIDKEEVLYAQQNLTAASDYFEITLWTLEVSIPKIIVNISVVPLVKQRPIPAVIGEKTAITISHLDASSLAILTNSNPVFQITRKPRFGKFRRIIPSTNRYKRQTKEKETSLFTHEDVQNEFIYYVTRKSDLNESFTDNCEYLLTAPNVQPAFGVLEFSISPSGTVVAESKSGLDIITPHGASSSGNRKTSKSSTDYPTAFIPDIVSENSLPGGSVGADVVLIVGIVCGILVLVLAILIALRCRTKQHARTKRKQELNPDNGDLQLERLTNSLKKNGSKQNRSFNYEVTDAYRSHHSGQRQHDSDAESDAEPPLPPRPDHIDPPLSPRPSRTKRVTSPGSGTSTVSSLPGSKKGRGSWYDSARDTPPSVPQCKIIPLHPLITSCDASEASEVNMRYPYGVPDDSLEEWAMLDSHSDVRYNTPRTTNPMLRKNQYWV